MLSSACDVITVAVDVAVVSAQCRRFKTVDVDACELITVSVGVSWWLDHKREA